MLDLLNKVETETATTTAAKRERVEAELRTDATRSDRKIAEVVGVDHKTVGAARARLGNSISPDDPTATQMRRLLIAGTEDFDRKFPQETDETAEEAVDRAIAEGKISTKPGARALGEEAAPKLPPDIEKLVDAAIDQIAGAKIRDRNAREAEVDAASEKNEEFCLLPPRQEVTIQHDEDRGRWIIRQRNWPDEDGVIELSDEDIHQFVDLLTDHLGYGMIRGS